MERCISAQVGIELELGMDTDISHVYITGPNIPGLWHKKNYTFTCITTLSDENVEGGRIVLRGLSGDAVEMPPLQIVRLWYP